MEQVSEISYAAGSYRDRGARVFHAGGRVLRALNRSAVADWRALAASPSYALFQARGEIVQTRELAPRDRADLPTPAWAVGVLEHAPIPFWSYPYEWCFSMLRAASLLHLHLMRSFLPEGLILKDASPYNVQFVGHRPVFIDLGSFTQYQPHQPWSAYRQFCELHLIPLMIQAYRGIDFQPWLRGNLEGVRIDQASRWFSVWDWLRPGLFTHVGLHGWLQRAAERGIGPTSAAWESSGFSVAFIQRNVARLIRLVERLDWRPPQTAWTDYDSAQPHVQQDRETKREFVRCVCAARRRDLVWDLGCNLGQYAKLAAAHADTVVAMDQDHGCVEALYRELRAQGPHNILPLCVDLANPSPALGWRGRERLRLEDRGHPDLTLCLGLIHHLVISANIPLPELVDWFGELTRELVLEFPFKTDPMVQRLLRFKGDQYEDYSLEELEQHLCQRFEIVARTALPSGHRVLLHAVAKE